jgi:hypothetical protein
MRSAGSTRRVKELFARVGLLCVVVVTLLAAVEIACRLAGVDFDAGSLERVSYYYRKPDVYEGGMLRRAGPAVWRGKPISGYMRAVGLDPGPWYADEPELEIRYDAEGFRNPEGLIDWDVAVAGDSFTELGNLPDAALPTAVLARASGLTVKNLGCSFTGTTTHVAYLEAFGRAPRCRTWLIAFFEGNDLADILREEEVRLDVDEGRWVVQRPQPQRSFGRAVLNAVLPRGASDFQIVNGRFEAPTGVVSDLTLHHAPPSSTELGPAMRGLLDGSLARYVEHAERAGVEPWLVFMPCKERVLHLAGRVEASAAVAPRIARWRPNDLPEHLRAVCRARGIAFVDVTPSLVQLGVAGVMPFNGVFDTHLTEAGAAVVGNHLALALREAPGRATARHLAPR